MSDSDKKLVLKDTLSYQEMQKLAASEDLSIRCQLAERQDIKPEILYFLAEDDASEVRRIIATNPATPQQADMLLAHDDEESVRMDLVEKVARNSRDANAVLNSKIQDLAYEALKILSRDQATRVRQILSETLKDVVDAPGDIIKHLATDMELVVAGPVLQFSPVLSDDDLLEIITSSHPSGALNAISKRKSVSEVISDAVIASDEESAITDLLSNQSAQIREDTLDMLVERAETTKVWHEPLVARPKLSNNAAKRMAHFLADTLLASLRKRQDLSDEVMETIEEQVKKRIDSDEPAREEESDPIDDMRALKEAGELDEDKLLSLIDDNEWLCATSALAVMADMRRVTVKKILASHSGKGIMALAWKAGLSAHTGESIQFKLAKMPINNLLKATEDGDFPLNEDELSWHLELFGDN
ncbi:MAG: DUF2336 domain-containing protein [Methylocystaceae bacterium]|nr:DUF2336 domain-containing protein [Methylocystaceae bacterium]